MRPKQGPLIGTDVPIPSRILTQRCTEGGVGDGLTGVQVFRTWTNSIFSGMCTLSQAWFGIAMHDNKKQTD